MKEHLAFFLENLGQFLLKTELLAVLSDFERVVALEKLVF